MAAIAQAPETTMICLCQGTDLVIPTEAKPRGGIWFRTKGKLEKNERES